MKRKTRHYLNPEDGHAACGAKSKDGMFLKEDRRAVDCDRCVRTHCYRRGGAEKEAAGRGLARKETV